MSDKTKAIVGTAVAVGAITAASLAYLYRKNANESIPTKWKAVGQIVDLNYFPVKSCAPVKRDSFDCHELGIEYNGIFDRSFVVSQNNKQVTARTYPKMVLIQCEVSSHQLILKAPGTTECVVNLDELKKGNATEKVQLWSSTANGIDAGDDVANWLSEHITGKTGVHRLIFYPHSYPTRIVKKDVRYKAFKSKDVGTYHDETSYMLINQASIDELNTHLQSVVKPLQFRPNIVVKGPDAYEEDNWKWVRIGDNVVLRGLKPCQRCIFTNIDPDTAERNPQREPLETLIKNRTLIPNESPVMGLHLAIRAAGKISIGDTVYINDESED